MRKVDEDVIIADWEEILLSELTANPPTKLEHGNTCQHKEKKVHKRSSTIFNCRPQCRHLINKAARCSIKEKACVYTARRSVPLAQKGKTAALWPL